MAFGVAMHRCPHGRDDVESGKPLGSRGAFQSVQWAGISVATILVGSPAATSHTGAIWRAPCSRSLVPVVALVMAGVFVHEVGRSPAARSYARACAGIRTAMGDRTTWVVAGFIFF